jgi:hypothetical protein
MSSSIKVLKKLFLNITKWYKKIPTGFIFAGIDKISGECGHR